MLQPAKRIAALALAISLAALSLGSNPHTTYAATDQELQQQVESATTTYKEAVERLAQVQEKIDDNQERISRIEKKLPRQRKHAAESLKALYLMHASSNGLLELLFTSDSFIEFINTIKYLDRVQTQNVTKLQELSDLKDELNDTKGKLISLKAEARHEVEVAQRAQEDAIAARDAAREQAIAKAEAEEKEAQAALKVAAKKAKKDKTFTNTSGQETKIETPSDTITVVDENSKKAEDADSTGKTKEPAKEPESKKDEPQYDDDAIAVVSELDETAPISDRDVITVVSERDAFVDEWAPRIDAYLAGSPLESYGATFAEAAWDYGVDPRWSPAISCIESSKGTICFRPHNAWGWGNSSWDDWDTAIRDHVAGLASGYGYTISVEAAKKYCPPHWEAWYSSVLAEMNSI